MKVSNAQVRNVATLARLKLHDDEVEALAADMNSILEYVDKLDELDTDGVEPTTSVVATKAAFRDDEVTNGSDPDATLRNAPDRHGNFFAVPSIIE